MKKKLINTFKCICISYTIILIITTLTNICISGLEHCIYSTFLLEIFLLLIVYWGIDFLTEQIYFFQKLSPPISVIIQVFIEYVVSFLFAVVFNWCNFDLKNILRFTITFMLIEIIVRNIFYHKMKNTEEEINSLIASHNSSQH